MSAPASEATTGASGRPLLGIWGLWNLSFGFFGIQVAFALQGANVSRIFQTLGASIDDLPLLWIAAPVTGLLVQPMVGHLSDRTWLRWLGRRRPYFLGGTVLAAIALVAMPDARTLWIAAVLLWMLDASINIAMEPFRAFVGDMLDPAQRTRGYAFQTIFIGTGAVAAACAPTILTDWLGIANVAPAGLLPPSVRYAFYAGAVVLVATVVWTVVSTREFPPDPAAVVRPDDLRSDADAPGFTQGIAWLITGACLVGVIRVLALAPLLYILGFGLVAFGAAQLVNRTRLLHARGGLLNQILTDLNTMPSMMRRLAIVHFLSWFGLFVLWIYATPVVTENQFGAKVVGSAAYNAGANWVGVLFGAYNAVAALYAFAIPLLVRRFGAARLHATNLVAGAIGLASVALIHDPHLLLASMIGVGMAWASILTIPYALLSDALPAKKLGVYMGLFNIFIVLPQLLVSTVMGSLGRALYPHASTYHFLVGAVFMLAAAVAALRLLRTGAARL